MQEQICCSAHYTICRTEPSRRSISQFVPSILQPKRNRMLCRGAFPLQRASLTLLPQHGSGFSTCLARAADPGTLTLLSDPAPGRDITAELLAAACSGRGVLVALDGEGAQHLEAQGFSGSACPHAPASACPWQCSRQRPAQLSAVWPSQMTRVSTHTPKVQGPRTGYTGMQP